VQVAVADLECEQDVEPPQLDRAVDVEEVESRVGAENSVTSCDLQILMEKAAEPVSS
jgi:hypothetical protein